MRVFMFDMEFKKKIFKSSFTPPKFINYAITYKKYQIYSYKIDFI